jgi:hypothetical protein
LDDRLDERPARNDVNDIISWHGITFSLNLPLKYVNASRESGSSAAAELI